MNYLITGIGGSGKSTLAGVLSAARCEAVDADRGYSHCVERATGKSFARRPERNTRLDRLWNLLEKATGKSFKPSDIEWANRFDWVWKEERMDALLRRERDHDLFVLGVAPNQAAFYPLFEKIFLLSIDEATLRHRLTTRTNSLHGKRPGDLEKILGTYKELEASVQRAGAVVLDASRPSDDIGNEILKRSRARPRPVLV